MPDFSSGRASADSLADQLRLIVDDRLGKLIPEADAEGQSLAEAMRFSLLSPGKRVRPLLTLMATLQLGGDTTAALDTACALEMIHTASLVLDDLPCMDNAAMRRGLPAVHKRYGEDGAILAAIALMNRAYGVVVSDPKLSAATRLRLVEGLSTAIGPDGLVSGQSRDLTANGRPRSREEIEDINHQKTGVLFQLAVESGAVIAEADDSAYAPLRSFARHVGLAFQASDDVLDAMSCVAIAGKDVGQDAGKSTLVSELGVAQACGIVRQHLADAHACLRQHFPGHPPYLQELLDSLFRELPTE